MCRGLPEILRTAPECLVKGYSQDDRIVYGTGVISPTQDLPGRLAAMFANPGVACVHLRSARNNCYQARVDRNA